MACGPCEQCGRPTDCGYRLCAICEFDDSGEDER